jgi:hypothetical protein
LVHNIWLIFKISRWTVTSLLWISTSRHRHAKIHVKILRRAFPGVAFKAKDLKETVRVPIRSVVVDGILLLDLLTPFIFRLIILKHAGAHCIHT